MSLDSRKHSQIYTAALVGIGRHDGTHLVDIISWLLDEKLSKPMVTGIYKDEKNDIRNFSAHFTSPSCSEITVSMSGRSRFFSFGLDILGT